MKGTQHSITKYQKVFESHDWKHKLLKYCGIKTEAEKSYKDFFGIGLTDDVGNILKIYDDNPNEGKITGYYDSLREDIEKRKAGE